MGEAGFKAMYTSYKVGNLTVKNRLVKSAMFEFGADNGRITDGIKNIYKEAAEGGIGLIFTGMHSINATGGIGPHMVQATEENYVNDLSDIVAAVQPYDCKIFVQLQHAGPGTDNGAGYDHFAASEMTTEYGALYKEATKDDINKVVKDWGNAARRCKLAGADGVQIHAAHGFLMTTFLSPHFNKRTDEYGGTIENRARLLFEVYDSVRNAVGNDYPIALKISFNDLIPDSTSPEDMLWVCKTLEKKGLNMIEISSGISVDGSASSCTPFIKKGDREGNFLEYAIMVAQEVEIPVASVCGYRTPEFVESVLKNSPVTAISFGRPLVCEPDLPNKWKKSNEPSRCRSCNRCFESIDVITCNFGR